MTIQRDQAVVAVRGSLVRQVSPRTHMLLLVGVTAATGLGTSYLLLHAGVTVMALRYPLAVGVGYAAFLGLIRLWLRRYRLRARVASRERDTQPLLDVLELPLDELFTSGPPEPHVAEFTGGGGFSGGGGGSSWGSGASSVSSDAVSSLTPSGGGVVESAGDVGGWDLDVDEGALWLVPIAIIAAIALGAVAYIVYFAPTLFAELLLDAGLAAGLYRRLLRMERRSWLATAVRRTIIPACFVAALLALAGTIVQNVYPDAASIGAVVRSVEDHGAQ